MAPRNYGDMAFNVAGLLQQGVGASRSHTISEPEIPLDETSKARNLSGEARLLRIGTGILASGTVEADVTLECSRCLTEIAARLGAELEEEYRPSVEVHTGRPAEVVLDGESEEDFSRIGEDHVLDLSEAVRQSILVSLPYSPLCKEACAGLCPNCGADLNVESCGCASAPGDPRLAGLAALLDRME